MVINVYYSHIVDTQTLTNPHTHAHTDTHMDSTYTCCVCMRCVYVLTNTIFMDTYSYVYVQIKICYVHACVRACVRVCVCVCDCPVWGFFDFNSVVQ